MLEVMGELLLKDEKTGQWLPVTALLCGSGNAADTIPTYVKEEAERVAAAVQNHQGLNTLSIIVASDFHHSLYNEGYKAQFAESLKHCGQGMNLVAKKAHVDTVARLGDYTWDNGQTPEEAMAEMRAVFAATHVPGLPEINVTGNHDINSKGTVQLTALQLFRLIGIRNAGAVYSTEKATGDCYRDYAEQRLRLIGISSSPYFPSTAQLNWLAATLNAMEEGWQAVILTHCPLNWNGSTTAAQALKPFAHKILCIVHGHTHNYLVSELEDTGIKQIAIPSANYARSNGYAEPWFDPETPGNETEGTLGKEAGNEKDAAFCVLTFDVDNAKVYADHYGAGYSRIIDVSKAAQEEGYTNLVPTAQEYGSTAPYNGTGYQNDYYVGSSAAPWESSGDSATVLTGFIPYPVTAGQQAPTIYIKGGEWQNISHCRLSFFEGKDVRKFAIVGNATDTTATNHIEHLFSVETLGDKYYKLTPKQYESGGWAFDYYGYVGGFFRMSLVAEDGADLVVTLDQEIV